MVEWGGRCFRSPGYIAEDVGAGLDSLTIARQKDRRRDRGTDQAAGCSSFNVGSAGRMTSGAMRPR